MDDDVAVRTDTERLEDYLTFVRAEHAQMRDETNSVSAARELAKRVVPVRHRGAMRVLATRVVRARELRKARAYGPGQLLHLGSGGVHKDGWVNIDLVGDPVDLSWDLSTGLPFPDGSVRGIAHEHVLEHLPLEAGLTLTRECHRVLAPGGVLRVGVPDAGLLASSYTGDGVELEAYSPGRPTRLLALQETFYWHHHETMFDEETLALVFRAAGFPDPVRRQFGESALAEVDDTEARRLGTLYVEAVR